MNKIKLKIIKIVSKKNQAIIFYSLNDRILTKSYHLITMMIDSYIDWRAKIVSDS